MACCDFSEPAKTRAGKRVSSRSAPLDAVLKDFAIVFSLTGDARGMVYVAP